MRLIDADAVNKEIKMDIEDVGLQERMVFYRINEAPTIDAVEVVRGEWIEHKERTIVMDNNFVDFFPTEYECSNCGLRQATYFINSTLPNYCPNCGARMKGADNE